jgi:FkbM family methyltransferase
LGRKASFVLAACDDGPMILPRFDGYTRSSGEVMYGVGQTLLETGSHEDSQVDLVIRLSLERRKTLDRNIQALDIGANIGSFTVPWAKAMTGWGDLLAFEAQERIYYALCGNVILNNLDNVHVRWQAIGDRIGQIAQQVPQYDQPGHFSGVSLHPRFNSDVGQQCANGGLIPLVTVDSLALEYVDIIKSDIEGMEPEMLRGAVQTIARHQPIIWVEAIFGIEGVLGALPKDYTHRIFGGNILAMHAYDPIWPRLEIIDGD